ncbi:MAG TPA: hypothetical protein VHM91_04010, partial [Verrucomicrobiales bacterium]|nr:hypothetical protein [Verrucomicrobiales bacterium]
MSASVPRISLFLLLILLCSCEKPAASQEPQLSSLRAEIDGLKSQVASLKDQLNLEISRSRSLVASDIEHSRTQINQLNARLTEVTKAFEEFKKALPEKAPETTASKPAPPEPPPRPRKDDLPYGVPLVGQKGMVYSPYAPEKGG